MMSCMEEALTTTGLEVEPSSTSLALSREQITPHSVLGGGLNGSSGFAHGKAVGRSAASNGTFVGPLFGLATAPNGDILVADAGQGVVTLSGALEIFLPGVSGISPIGRGTMWAIKGLTTVPGDDTGQALYRASKGNNRLLVDLFAFEAETNPDGGVIDSNPFDVESLGGNAALVVDAGGNVLLRVDNQGNVEVLAVFPSELVSTANLKELLECPESQHPLCGFPDMMPAEAVPTSVAVGPDGYYYVGELKGFPAPTGASNIWRVAPGASWADCGSSPDCVKVFDGGFTSIIDMKFDASGMLHVAELEERSWLAVESFGPGALAGGTINACDIDAGSCTEVATGIPMLTAITFGKGSSLWATKNALIPGAAEVIKVQ
jgi:hypothetical protein